MQSPISQFPGHGALSSVGLRVSPIVGFRSGLHALRRFATGTYNIMYVPQTIDKGLRSGTSVFADRSKFDLAAELL
jgi:hypothetical protein